MPAAWRWLTRKLPPQSCFLTRTRAERVPVLSESPATQGPFPGRSARHELDGEIICETATAYLAPLRRRRDREELTFAQKWGWAFPTAEARVSSAAPAGQGPRSGCNAGGAFLEFDSWPARA